MEEATQTLELEPTAEKTKKIQDPKILEFLQKLQEIATNEEKLHMALDYMKRAISQDGQPDFKGFWEAKHQALLLFKGALNGAARSNFWAEFVSLSDEARRLKTVLDEQASFALEQIDLAITGLESEVALFDEKLAQLPEEVFPHSETIAAKKDVYSAIQKRLTLLNGWAVRMNALRKEIMKTNMRIRDKNKFLQRLSLLGDTVFPKRKEGIKEVSELFLNDIQALFVDQFFKEVSDIEKAPMYVLREEIKALQDMTKRLTLSTQSFTESRLKLSDCWNKVKEFEKEYKKEAAQKRQELKQNFDAAQERIKQLETASAEISSEEFLQKKEEVLIFLRDLDLRRDDVRVLKNSLQAIQESVSEKNRNEKDKKEKDSVRLKKEKIVDLKKAFTDLAQNGKSLSLEELVSEWKRLQKDLKDLLLTQWEEKGFEVYIKAVKDLIVEKKEKAIIADSNQEQVPIEQLRLLLEQRKEYRQEIREQIENYRKILGGSGLDFEKAIMYRDLLEEEKLKLEKATTGIVEIETKISALEGDSC